MSMTAREKYDIEEEEDAHFAGIFTWKSVAFVLAFFMSSWVFGALVALQFNSKKRDDVYQAIAWAGFYFLMGAILFGYGAALGDSLWTDIAVEFMRVFQPLVLLPLCVCLFGLSMQFIQKLMIWSFDEE